MCIAALSALVVKDVGAQPAKPSPPSAAVSIKKARAVRQSTALLSGGRAPVILTPASELALAAADKLRAALQQRLGVETRVATKLADATPGQQTVIALGNMLDNELLTRLYFNRYTFEDAQFPGPDGYTVHAVYDPYPWGGDQDVIVLGASRPEQLGRAVERFLSLLQGERAQTVLPYVLVVEPAKPLSPKERDALLARPVDPSFTAFRVHAEKYLQTGDEAYARVALAALDIMADIYHKKPDRPTPWPEETTSSYIFAAWDAFEECPLIQPEQYKAYSDAILLWSRDLTRRSYQYKVIDEKFTVTWNHTTFALLGLYFAGRYFDRYYALPEAAEWLRRSRLGFAAQARSWKPQEDADSYLTLTMRHTIEYSLAEWDLRFFENGVIKQYADYVVACGDNRQWPAGFGDSGYSSSPSMAISALPIAYWWTRDGAYRWILDHVHPKGWANPYWQDVTTALPERFTGLNVFPIDRQIYDDTQKGPTYNEAFVKADVPFEDAWDKISFRENWEPEGQYLLLDGIGRGKHLHFDTNSIVTFVQEGERWLLDHDYLVRNTTEHAMLSVLRDGRCAELAPSLAGLASCGDLPGMAATQTYVRNYNGVDWQRRVLWRKGAWFLVQDTVTARQGGDYNLDLTWKTIDRGNQSVDGAGRFEARRAGTSDSSGLHVVDDPDASNGKAVVLFESASRLVFAVDLPKGEYAVDVIAYGRDTGSDSLFLSVDGGEPIAAHVAKGSYGKSSSTHDHVTDAPRIQVPNDGAHVVRVTLREHPPVRIDRIEFRGKGVAPVVIQADAAPAPKPGDVARLPASVLHIDPLTPVLAWVTNHVRQGISVPVSVLHQRQSANLKAGDTMGFCSLLYATGPKYPTDFAATALRPGVCRVAATGAGPVAIAGFGADQQGNWSCDADAWLISAQTVSLVAARRVGLGAASMAFAPAVNATLDVSSGKLTVTTSKPVTSAFRGVKVAAGSGPATDGPTTLPAGTHHLAVSGLAVAHLADAGIASPSAQAPTAPPTAGRPAPAQDKPLWRLPLVAGAPVTRITPADVDGDGQPELLVACGPAGHVVAPTGSLRWAHQTGGVVRDVSLARFTKDGPRTVLVSSHDTHLYLLDPAGKVQRKHQMTGIYFSADHGERPWGLYCTRAVDADGDGVHDMLVTTLASMESQGLDADLKKLWRTLAAYHGCMEMAVQDLNADGKPEIVIADKYGAVHVLRPDGKVVTRSSTSIGDVTFGLGDLDGDGKIEVVHGSSTGDMVAANMAGKTLWRFDNYGYPVERILCADVNGDGRPEVLLASGTGYLYCLDPNGSLLWARRLGLAVHDVTVSDRLIVVGTEDGDLHALDAAGKALWSKRLGASVTKLASLTVAGQPVLIAGLADGHLLAFPAR